MAVKFEDADPNKPGVQIAKGFKGKPVKDSAADNVNTGQPQYESFAEFRSANPQAAGFVQGIAGKFGVDVEALTDRAAQKSKARTGQTEAQQSNRKPDNTEVNDDGTTGIPKSDAKVSTNETEAKASQQIINDQPQPVRTDPNRTSTRRTSNLPNLLENELEQFASVTPLWTMACLTPQQFNNPDTYRNTNDFTSDFFLNDITGEVNESSIIFSSAGRFGADRVSVYGANAPEYYIDNFKMTTLTSANIQSGNQNAINFEFDIFEPYSMGLLLQSMQNAAIKAGYANYLDNAPYLLKLDFQGFKENGEALITARSKYFVMRLTKVNFDVDESGSKYQVKGIPFNHSGFGDTINTLFVDVALEAGTEGTVKEVLVDPKNARSLCQVLNRNEQRLVDAGRIRIPDVYEIQFPERSEDFIRAASPQDRAATTSVERQKTKIVAGSGASVITDFGKNEIGQSTFGFDQTDGGNFTFKREDDITDEDGRIIRDKMLIDPNKRTFMFTQEQTLTDIITQVVLNSQYAADALNPDNMVAGFIRWFRLDVQIEFLDYDALVGDYARKITYRVVPFLVHHSIFSNPSTPGIGYDKLQEKIVKGYNYIYTGQNTDILKFDVSINNLFYKGVTAAPEQDNPSERNQNQQGIAEDPPNKTQTPVGGDQRAQVAELGTGRIRPKPIDYSIKGGPGTTSTEKQVALAFHQAFIEGSSKDLIVVNLEVLGDPYYMSDSGINNYFSSIGLTDLILQDGSMNYEGQDVYIYIAFRTPNDVNTETGMYDFANDGDISPFSGIYKVVKVENVFESGVFKQNLKCLRMSGQSIDYDFKPIQIDERSATATKVEGKEKPAIDPSDPESSAKNLIQDVFGIDISQFPPPEPKQEEEEIKEVRLFRSSRTGKLLSGNFNIDRSQPSRLVSISGKKRRVYGTEAQIDEFVRTTIGAREI